MNYPARLHALAAVCLIGALGAAHAGDWRTLGNAVSVKESAHGVEIAAEHGAIQITVLSEGVFRVRYSTASSFPDNPSFAVVPNAFPKPAKAAVRQDKDPIVLDAGTAEAVIYRTPLRVAFTDAAGRIVSEDSPTEPVAFDGARFRVSKSMPENEHYFGLGDKTGPLDHRDLAFTMWNTDAFGWQESTDPLYKSIPFLLATRGGSAYGLFLDDAYRSFFEFGKETRGAYHFGADGGALDYYFFYGPSPKQVIAEFTQLTGRMPLPPLFSLGYQQCRWSYYPESEVRDLAAQFRRRKIPADVIYLDIDYQKENRPFTVDRERFPNFEGMIQDLLRQGFHLIAITDLHIAKLAGYAPYDQGVKGDYFVKNPDGSNYVGKVWPGDSVFPDFTRAEVRRWWGTLYSEFVKDGIRGFWNDMNEPAIFERADKTMPLDTVHSVEGRKTDHREIHNVFGMENARATYEGLLQLKPDQRPFVLTRAAYAGAWRYAATWTGDNSSTWNHMRISVSQLLNLGLSGYAFVGDDIGGFNGSPTPELLTRWMELGAFNPIYRNHSMKGTRRREPWVDGLEHEAIRKRYIQERYRLLPYIYTGLEEASRTGTPLMRPMFLEFPDDASLSTENGEFMFGSALLVAPKLQEFTGAYPVALPKGDWYDYWTGAKIAGGASIDVDPPLDTLPVFVRAGAIIPEQPVVQSTSEKPAGPLELRVYPGPRCGGDLYADDGNTLAYQRGKLFRARFTCELSADHLDIRLPVPTGPYRPWFTQARIIAYGLSGKVRGIAIDGKPLSGWTQAGDQVTLPPVSWPASARAIRVSF